MDLKSGMERNRMLHGGWSCRGHGGNADARDRSAGTHGTQRGTERLSGPLRLGELRIGSLRLSALFGWCGMQ